MKQIIFDLDDTLYNNKLLRIKREKAILKFVGNKKEEYLDLKKKNGTIDSLKVLGIKKDKFFRIINQVRIDLDTDLKLIEIFKRIKKDFKTVILSNNSEHCVKTALEKLGIKEFVDKAYSGEDFEKSKPSKECFFMVRPGDICVGNNFEKDLAYPMKIGAITVMVGQSDEADFNIKDIYELEKCIENLEKNEEEIKCHERI